MKMLLCFIAMLVFAGNVFAGYSMTHQHDNGVERTVDANGEWEDNPTFKIYVPHEHIFTDANLKSTACRKKQVTGQQRDADNPGTQANPNFETVTVWIYHDHATCANMLHADKTHDDVWTLDSARGKAYLNNVQSNIAISLGHSDPHHPQEESPDVDVRVENYVPPEPIEEYQAVTVYKGWNRVCFYIEMTEEKLLDSFADVEAGKHDNCFRVKETRDTCDNGGCTMGFRGYVWTPPPAAPKVVRRGKLALTWGALKRR